MKESMQDRCKAGSMLSPRWMVSISVVELQVLREQFSEGESIKDVEKRIASLKRVYESFRYR
jgi:hypothetical protein